MWTDSMISHVITTACLLQADIASR